MFLKYSDVSWQWFRATSTYSRHLSLADVNTLYVFSLFSVDNARAVESITLGVVSNPSDFSYSSDSIWLRYVGAVSDTSPVFECFSVDMLSSFVDGLVPVEVVSVRFASQFAEARLALDKISTVFVLKVRDALSLNEGFFFGGVFNVDINNVVLTLDKASSTHKTPSSDAAVVNEFIRVGLRHMIDFYLGGFALGSVVFGGRLR